MIYEPQEWSTFNFPLQYRYIVKKKSDENKQSQASQGMVSMYNQILRTKNI